MTPLLSDTGLGIGVSRSSLTKLKRTQNAEMVIKTHKDSIPLSMKIYFFFLLYFNWGLLHRLQNESFTQRKNGKWRYVHQFAGLRVWGFLFVFGSALATWHQYHFFPGGTDLTNHFSVLNKYHSEQCCWEESCLKGLVIVN